jgi:hypothetical protein
MVDTVIIVKMLNVPRELITPALGAVHSLQDGIAVMSLKPNFDVIKRKAPPENGSIPAKALPVAVNLIFDSAKAQENAETAKGLAAPYISHVDANHFSSFNAFSNFIINVGIPDLTLTDDFWIPVQHVLTEREMEILHLVYNGQSSKQIAETLAVSPRTIELHRQNCSGKLGHLTPRLLGALFSTDTLDTYRWCMTTSKGPN